MPTFTHALSTNNYGPNKFIVSPNAYEGTHTTIASANASASSGDTIIFRPGTYTENYTVDKSLTFYADTNTYHGYGNVTIIGKATISSNNINFIANGISFQTNGDYISSLTGSNSVISLTQCYVNCTNNSGFNLGSSTSSNLYMTNCDTITANGYALFTSTGATVFIRFSTLGISDTQSQTAGSLYINDSTVDIPIKSNAGGLIQLINCTCGAISTPYVNTTWVTHNDTTTLNSALIGCIFYSGTASAVSIGGGATLNMAQCVINSSNASAIAGTGTLNKGILTFTGSSSTIAGGLTVNTYTTSQEIKW